MLTQIWDLPKVCNGCKRLFGIYVDSVSFDESIFESQQRVEQTCKFFCHYSLTDWLFFTEFNGQFLVNEDLTVRPQAC